MQRVFRILRRLVGQAPFKLGAALTAFVLGCAGSGTAPEVGTTGSDPGAASRMVVRPSDVPGRIAHAPAVRVGDALYLAGQTGHDWQDGSVPEGIDAQTHGAMSNIARVLDAAGLSFAHLVKCHVFLASMDDYAGMNAAYGGTFDGRVPARTTVEVVALPHKAAVQIACVAHADLDGVSVVQVAPGALPSPLGPYSPAVWAGDTLYLSGMGGQFPADRRLPEPLGEQATQTLANIRTTLDAAGLTFGDVVSVHAYVTTADELADLLPAVRGAFGHSALPPLGISLLPRLPGGIKVEITVIAARGTGTRTPVGPASAADGQIRGLLADRSLYTRAESVPEAGADAAAQARAVLQSLEGTLRSGGGSLGDIVHLQIGLADLADLPQLRARLADALGDQDAPPRTVVQLTMPPGTRVQMHAVAVR